MPTNPLNTLAKNFTQVFVNQLKNLDSQVYTPLRVHAGKIMHVSITDFNIDLFYKIENDHLELLESLPENAEANTVLSGKLSSLIETALSVKMKSGSHFKPHLRVEGDIGLAQDFSNTFKYLDIDFEAHLSYFLGDSLAHHISKAFAKTKSWGMEVLDSRRQDISDYLKEEVKIFPHQEQLEDFYQHIDNIKHDVERLQARFDRLNKS